METRRGTRSRIAALGVAACALSAATLWAPASAASQDADIEPGVGTAFAQAFRVDPRSGRLSFGVGYGEVLAGHQNASAQASSRSVNLGVIGTTLGAEGCDGGEPTLPPEDQPQPLVVRAEQGDEPATTSDTDNGVTREVQVTPQPFARAVATVAGGGEEGVLEIGPTVATSTSGLIDGARKAVGRTDVSEISLAGGAVILRGLTWEAIHNTAPTSALSGSFSIEGIEVAGTALPVAEDNPLASLDQLNVVLAAAGLELTPPTITETEDLVAVGPLRIGVVPSDARDGLAGAVLGAIQPVRESVFDLLIEADCANAGYITIADVVLGSVTGAGSLNLEIGGVTATSDEIDLFDGFQPLPPAPQTPAPAVDGTTATPAPIAPTTPAAVGPSSAPAAPPSPPTPTVPPSGDDTTELAAVTPLDTAGSRGGALAAVGLATVGVLAAMAEGDRRKMRRAQRELAQEA